MRISRCTRPRPIRWLALGTALTLGLLELLALQRSRYIAWRERA